MKTILNKTKQNIKKSNVANLDAPQDSGSPSSPDEGGTLTDHLVELRRRIMLGLFVIALGFGCAYGFKEQVFGALTAPLFAVFQGEKMVFTAVHELFFTYIKLSFLCGLFVGLPFLINQLWLFISPGLYSSERNFLSPFLILSPLLFYLGGVFSYFLVMPLALEFFFSFANSSIVPLPSVREYLGFFIKITFGFGIAFQLPVLILVLAFTGVVTVEKLRRFRRYAYVFIVLLSAILTPPDPISQILLAVPMAVLYELSILFVLLRRKKDAPAI